MADLQFDVRTLRGQILADIELEAMRLGVTAPPTEPGSDHWLRAHPLALRLVEIASHVAVRESAYDPDLASESDVLQQARRMGIDGYAERPSRGRIVVRVDGTTPRLIQEGAQVALPGGGIARVEYTHPSVTDHGEVAVVTTATGSESEVPAGGVVRFVSPPPGVRERAVVSESAPIVGGQTGTDVTSQLRSRIKERLRFGGAPTQMGAVSDAIRQACGPRVDGVWFYPALGGPATSRAIVTQSLSRAGRRFTRLLPDAELQLARQAAHAVSDAAVTLDVTVPTMQSVNLGVVVYDTARAVFVEPHATCWPTGGSYVAFVETASSSTRLRITCGDRDPVSGVSQIAWYSPDTLEIVTATVVDFTDNGTGDYWVTLDEPMEDSEGNAPQADDWVFPAPRDPGAVADSLVALQNRLGPGEQIDVTLASGQPRAARLPRESAQYPSWYTPGACAVFAAEIGATGISGSHASNSTSPGSSSPSDVETPAYLQQIDHFGIYPVAAS